MSAITKLDPIISEFDTEDDAKSYDQWFRVKVQEALDDPTPPIPHDEFIAQMHAFFEALSDK